MEPDYEMSSASCTELKLGNGSHQKSLQVYEQREAELSSVKSMSSRLELQGDGMDQQAQWLTGELFELYRCGATEDWTKGWQRNSKEERGTHLLTEELTVSAKK